MVSIDENLKVLSRAVLNDVQDEADQILDQAKTKAEGIRQRAKEQAEAERTKILDHASVEAERVRSQAVATSQLKARTMLLEQREKLLDEVFETAKQRLSSVLRGSDYQETAQRLVKEAVHQLKAESAMVRADEETMKALSTSVIEKLSKETQIKIKLGDSLEKGLGVIAETEDGHRQYDNTLETRLKRMQDTLRSSVHRILMGEAL
ncbi:MAG: V-type ATP synthase subunit E [Anaerolineales bacterium]|jgi:V/A-type H+-transporting ATPase subunit E